MMQSRIGLSLVAGLAVQACAPTEDPRLPAMHQPGGRLVALAQASDRSVGVNLYVPTEWTADVRAGAQGPVMQITGDGIVAQVDHGVVALRQTCGSNPDCSDGVRKIKQGEMSWKRFPISHRFGTFLATEQLTAAAEFSSSMNGGLPTGVVVNGFCATRSHCDKLLSVADSLTINK